MACVFNFVNQFSAISSLGNKCKYWTSECQNLTGNLKVDNEDTWAVKINEIAPMDHIQTFILSKNWSSSAWQIGSNEPKVETWFSPWHSQLGHRDKMPLSGWLTQQMFVSHGSGAWEVQDQGWLTWFLLRALFLACSLPSSQSCACACEGERGSRVSAGSPASCLITALIPSRGPHPPVRI